MSAVMRQYSTAASSCFHSIDSYQMGRSHSALNWPSLDLPHLVFQEEQGAANENSKKLDSEALCRISIVLDSAFKLTPVIREFQKNVNALYHEARNDIELLSDRKRDFYDKPLKDLINKIHDIYNERQDENWDGYGAEPLKFLPQAVRFAESLFSESKLLAESADIIPENDGCLCFEWHKSDKIFISVSVKGERLIYNYQIVGEKGCGERNFLGKKDIIEKIKQAAAAGAI